MGYKLILSFTVFLLLCYCEGSLAQVLETRTNTSGEFVYVLRGRDGIQGRCGRSGRDGLQGRDGTPGGPRGERGSQGKQGPPGSNGGGATFIRWGKSNCPDTTQTELVYSGIAGGTMHDLNGGGSNYLCLPKDPEYSSTLTYEDGVQDHILMEGSEYQYPLQGLHNHNVPCAVCYVPTRTSVIMIPAKASCPAIWTMEYYGYLMTEQRGDRRTTFECVDKSMEALPGSQADTNGALFYHIEANCGTGLPCEPYNNHQELNCVVCTN